MTVTLDGKTIRVKGGGIDEAVHPVGTFSDEYKNEEYSKKGWFVGQYKTWTLQCYDDSVPWGSCTAKHLQEQLDAGASVVFTLDEGNLHAVAPINVYILGLSISYKQGSSRANFIRNFTLKLQEAPA
ncbi:MAG: hypothetical protein NWF05_08935 [Candidatus Bathyarchaeota archaeon]|nr:hypothetical protein [Candidatus Bathyarchaeota archaeon]